MSVKQTAQYLAQGRCPMISRCCCCCCSLSGPSKFRVLSMCLWIFAGRTCTVSHWGCIRYTCKTRMSNLGVSALFQKLSMCLLACSSHPLKSIRMIQGHAKIHVSGPDPQRCWFCDAGWGPCNSTLPTGILKQGDKGSRSESVVQRLTFKQCWYQSSQFLASVVLPCVSELSLSFIYLCLSTLCIGLILFSFSVHCN